MLGKNDFLFDKRLAERFIKRGSLNRKDYEAYLKSLPDVTDKGEPLVPEGQAEGGAEGDPQGT